MNLATAKLEKTRKQKRIRKLNEATREKDQLKLFNTIDTWKGKSKLEVPEKLTVNGKEFKDERVLKGFALATEEQAQQEGMYNTSSNKTYVDMKVHNAIYRKLLKLSHKKV